MNDIKKALAGAKTTNTRLNYTLKLEKIPEELKNINQWVCWQGIYMPEKDKFDKIPKNARTGGNASSANSKTWSSFQEAVDGMERFQTTGIGIVLTTDIGIVGIDVDHCYNDGQFSDEAREILESVNSYTEFSPSGTGIRIFVKGALPPTGRKRGKIEMYDSGRFLTVTGNRISEVGNVIENQDQVHRIHTKYLYAPKPEPKRVVPAYHHSSKNSSEILRKIEGSKNSEKFKALYNGDISGYASHSDADLALCNLLAYWCDGDSNLIDDIFRGSALMRDKWDKKFAGTTYGKYTIDKAIAGGKNG